MAVKLEVNVVISKLVSGFPIAGYCWTNASPEKEKELTQFSSGVALTTNFPSPISLIRLILSFGDGGEAGIKDKVVLLQHGNKKYSYP